MSNEAVLGLSITQPVTHRERGHHSPHGEQSFTFVSQRWRRGLAIGSGALAQFALGTFLLSEIHATPGLRSQLAVVGSVLLICGAACMVSAIRDLFGRLVIDDHGIAIRPNFTGFSIPWDKIQRCEVKDIHSRHSDSPYILIWSKGSDTPLYIPYGWLSDQDRHQIQAVLHTRVPSEAMAI
jgi:hypothetical protein